MDTFVHVDASDNAACNLRCVGAAPFCNRYPHCVAGMFHKVRDALVPGHPARQVVREYRKRSAQGGHSRTRIVAGPDPHSTVEEVELHCETLKFESLLKTVPLDTRLTTAPIAPRQPTEAARQDH